MSTLKIVFAGTPGFAAVMMEALLASRHQIVLVMTQPDRPAGRGMKLQASHVKIKALESHIPVVQPASLKLDGKYPEDAQACKEVLEQLDFDVLVVAAYGLLLPTWVLDLVKTKNPVGCINVHASLLPRWRGAAPIHRAILSGDTQTGNCIMQMAEGLDTGDVLASEALAIQSLDTTETLHDRLALQGSRLLMKVLDQVATGKPPKAIPQESLGITYAQKILKEEARINWESDAVFIDRQIRAFNPSPGAFTTFADENIKIWLSEEIAQGLSGSKKHQPGQIIEMNDLGISVATKKGSVRLLEVQKAGAKRMSATAFLKTASFGVGDILV